MSSFVSPRQATFAPGEIQVLWHEHSHQNTYVVYLGHEVSMHLLPADARELVAKLTAAMAVRGDLAEPIDAAVREAADAAEERQWEALGRAAKAVPTVADEIDVVCDRERDRVVGL